MPVSYRSVRVHAPLPAAIRSWVRIGADSRADGPFATFDVTLCDADGAVLVEVEGFAIRRLDDGRLRADAPADRRRGRVRRERRRPAAVAGRGAARAQPLAGHPPAGGRGRLRPGARAGEPQVVVTSLDLDALIAQAAASAAAAPKAGQAFERPELDSAYVEPRNDIERMLAGFWQELLGVGQVGVEDSFFDLGGHSLIAVRLFVMIKKAYRVEFPISVLFEAPTIAKCAALIAERLGIDPAGGEPTEAAPTPARRRYKHLVAMHEGEGGPSTPFFLVAGMFGNVLNLRHLAHLLGADRPFYGLQARGLYGDEAPHATFEEAAADYIAELRTVQPHGPYLLGGFSGGGITAYEMARQLEADGEEVALLVMLDTPLPMRPALSRRRPRADQVAASCAASPATRRLGAEPAGVGARPAARRAATPETPDRRDAPVPRRRDRGGVPRRRCRSTSCGPGTVRSCCSARRSTAAGRCPAAAGSTASASTSSRTTTGRAGRRRRGSSRCRATTTRWCSSRTSACSPRG